MNEQELLKEIEALKRSNVLWGKSLVACGDSFTEGDFTNWTDSEGRSNHDSPVIFDSEMNMYKTYPWWIAKRNNMRLKNFGKCGGTIAIPRDYLASPDTVDINIRKPFAHETYKNLGDDIDYILIMYGLNDMTNCELGTIDDQTNETFYGAFNVVYKYLIQKYPYTKIGAIVCNQTLREDYAKAVKEVSVKWGIPYLDLLGDTGISTTLFKTGMCDEAREIRNSQFFVAADNGHPNHIAHEFMSTYVEEFLRRL